MSQPFHRDTIFHLEPCNEAAKAAVQHPDNAPFLSSCPSCQLSLEIGYHVSSRPRGGQIIAKLGRGSDADLILLDKNVSQVHFAFEVHPISKAIILRVHPHRLRSVMISPPGFREDQHIRQRVLAPQVNCDIYIKTGERSKMHFNVHWPRNDESTSQGVLQGFQAAEERAINPRWVRTADEADSDLQSWYKTRLKNPELENVVRYALAREKIGEGGFGTVLKAIDLDSGHFIAVKYFKIENERDVAKIHREIQTMQTLKHPQIIEFLGYAGFDENEKIAVPPQLFMPLRSGSVRDLLPLAPGSENSICRRLTGQMLSALDYLSSRDLCHRDVKPANILYHIGQTSEDYRFQLADFGLAKHSDLAVMECGTRIFAAPELHPDYGLTKYRQSPKMDVWSLFVTIASVYLFAKFDERKLAQGPYSQIVAFVQESLEPLSGMKEMACLNPEERASAAQMLIKHFGGKGLTTNRS
ncbi:hypothetical protein HIM_04651 [Hirsutella minnesotensis 3608]|uniref:Protein kinase domain-containing protein n=1 Tax=Hirsutella minnesotensis 3608 TaxID=1043627 RepID=A0A0F8A133_9HYPO|nr:hypothetical protein HIM_04651 [Hirsutella minnesotensis 3608]